MRQRELEYRHEDPRLFDEEGWTARLGFVRRNAHAMTKAESLELSETIQVDAVWAYRNAVGRRTREVIAERGYAHWLDPFTQDDLHQAVSHNVVSQQGAHSMADSLVGLPREDMLCWWAWQHSLIHLGQATAVKNLIQAGEN